MEPSSATDSDRTAVPTSGTSSQLHAPAVRSHTRMLPRLSPACMRMLHQFSLAQKVSAHLNLGLNAIRLKTVANIHADQAGHSGRIASLSTDSTMHNALFRPARAGDRCNFPHKYGT